MIDGNDVAADSTAALRFASMEMILQSMAAVKTAAKREVLLMIPVPFTREKVFFKILVFKNWMPEDAVFLARHGKVLQNKPDREEKTLEKNRSPAIL